MCDVLFLIILHICIIIYKKKFKKQVKTIENNKRDYLKTPCILFLIT